MENTDLDIVIERARIFREKFIEKTKQDNMENGVETDENQLRTQITVKPLLGQIEIQVNGETVKKDVFLIEIEGETIGKIYDEDLTFIGAVVQGQQEIILSRELSSKPEQEQSKIKKDIKKMEPDSAKTIEELEEENTKNETEKKEKIAEDLEENMGEPGLEINLYRRIIDPAFMRQFPETCNGAKEVGMACLKDGRFVLVADYGNGFEVAKGTEPAIQTSEQMYDLDRGEQKVEETSPHALMKITGNGQRQNSIELSVTLTPEGIETKVVYRTNEDDRLATSIQQDRNGPADAIGSMEENVMSQGGEDAPAEIIAMVSDKQGEMEDSIVSNILEVCAEQLEDLYGTDKAKQEEAIRNCIEKTVKMTGNIIPEEIQENVEDAINTDWENTVGRGRNSH